jgi:hypothetical protein
MRRHVTRLVLEKALRSRPKRLPQRERSGPPAWLVFLVGVALVFGSYYLWLGLQSYLRTGGLGVVEATEQAVIVASATAERILVATSAVTPRPTLTPIPECLDFVVTAENAIVREGPSPGAAIRTSYFEGAVVCVLGRASEDSEWYVIDMNEQSRRVDPAYMHESVIRALNPTLTPTRTLTPTLPPTPLPTITATPSPRPTDTRIPGITDTPTPTVSPSPTLPVQSA